MGIISGAIALFKGVSAWAAKSAVNAAILNLGISTAGTVVARSLFKPNQTSIRPTELIRNLSPANSRPPYRYVYGRYRVYGTPVPWRVKGNILYGCILLNSRASAGGVVNIYIDKKQITAPSGDLFNFSGEGLRFQLGGSSPAFRDNERPRAWLGLGAQTGPPTRLRHLRQGNNYVFNSTDGWRGRTVLWLELNAGETGHRASRWPRVPPTIEVEMDYSKVWDPRESSQSAGDRDTWIYSNNHALVLLDTLRNNPIRKFRSANLINQSFISAANISDQSVPLRRGGSENRYTANGVIVWDGREIEEQIQPIVDSAAGTLIRVGGRLGYLPGAYRTPIANITDVLADGGLEYQSLAPGRFIPPGVKATYINPSRDWREAELPIRAVPTAPAIVGDDGVVNIKLPFCLSATQAMRVKKIEAMRAGLQKKLSVSLPPKFFEITAGATVTTAFTQMPHLNGEWEVATAKPGLSIVEPNGGVALRMGVELLETSASVYAWSSAEEDELIDVDYSQTTTGVQPPQNVVLTHSTQQGPFYLEFVASPTASVDSYEIIYGSPDGDRTVILPASTSTDGRFRYHISDLNSGGLFSIRMVRVRARVGTTYSRWARAVDTNPYQLFYMPY